MRDEISGNRGGSIVFRYRKWHLKRRFLENQCFKTTFLELTLAHSSFPILGSSKAAGFGKISADGKTGAVNKVGPVEFAG